MNNEECKNEVPLLDCCLSWAEKNGNCFVVNRMIKRYVLYLWHFRVPSSSFSDYPFQQWEWSENMPSALSSTLLLLALFNTSHACLWVTPGTPGASSICEFIPLPPGVSPDLTSLYLWMHRMKKKDWSSSFFRILLLLLIRTKLLQFLRLLSHFSPSWDINCARVIFRSTPQSYIKYYYFSLQIMRANVDHKVSDWTGITLIRYWYDKHNWSLCCTNIHLQGAHGQYRGQCRYLTLVYLVHHSISDQCTRRFNLRWRNGNGNLRSYLQCRWNCMDGTGNGHHQCRMFLTLIFICTLHSSHNYLWLWTPSGVKLLQLI